MKAYRVIAIVLITFMVGLIPNNVAVAKENVAFQSALESFFANAVLDDDVYQLSSFNEFELSYPIPCYSNMGNDVYAKAQCTCYAVIAEGVVQGVLCVQRNSETGYAFSYEEGIAKEMETSKDKVAILFDKGSRFLLRDHSDDVNCVAFQYICDFADAHAVSKRLHITKNVSPESVLTTPNAYSLNVPAKKQYDDTSCWAAGCASVLQYIKQSAYTCYGVMVSSGLYNGATMGQVRTVLQSYGVTPSTIGAGNQLTTSVRFDKICAGKPFLTGYTGTHVNTGATFDHMFTVRGYSSSSSSLYLKIIDPKMGGYVSVSVTSATRLKFTYNNYNWALGAWIYVGS
ncbi:MAG: hypothetical protein IJ744_04905 [Lachnospiraceae bacterium]|nr:hypothetical protein [Lachnospiraceae bacterium]